MVPRLHVVHGAPLHVELQLQLESGTCDVIDPWGGSYYVERLTHELAERAQAHIDEIEDTVFHVSVTDGNENPVDREFGQEVLTMLREFSS